MENSKETTKNLFNLTRLAQLGVEVPQDLNEEYKQISGADLTDAPNTVDIKVWIRLLRIIERPIPGL